MSGPDLGWYLRRLRGMPPSELPWRAIERVRQRSWSRLQAGPVAASVPPAGARPRPFAALLPQGAARQVDPQVRQAVLCSAEEILAGRWEVLGVTRTDLVAPDWFADPLTGRRAPDRAYCFSIDHRREEVTGNVKQVWELSRLHHLTVLAAAYTLSHDDRYAETAARHLRSWWAENPFLTGVHWTSGIEAGCRLVSWVWTRRLLEGWTGSAELFEDNPTALNQIWWHQRYLAAFRSRGSSANNHVIAEAAGQLVAALAFPWFAETERWARGARALLEEELGRNTFASGINREQAFDYHGFVAELALVAAVEADLAGQPLGASTSNLICRMLDAVAAVVDATRRAPRQGDGDDGHGLVLGPPTGNRWLSLLAVGDHIFGSLPWWPPCQPDATASLLAAAARPHPAPARSERRPSHFADSGLTILRSHPIDGPEIWCRCDGGPHGHLSIAAHAHADALAVEVRHDGVDILADPGTYCYHGEPAWRAYFRSTLAHNTVEVGGRPQSASGGPFLWTAHARSRVVEARPDGDGGVRTWAAEHDGYAALRPPVRHCRRVALLSAERRLRIEDKLHGAGGHQVRMAYHLGPLVQARLRGSAAELAWTARDGQRLTGTLLLAPELDWTARHGETSPILGWYSQRFGHKEPTTTLLGTGYLGGVLHLLTEQLRFPGAAL